MSYHKVVVFHYVLFAVEGCTRTVIAMGNIVADDEYDAEQRVIDEQWDRRLETCGLGYYISTTVINEFERWEEDDHVN